MDNWDEVRTAYHVVRSGTVSGAAEVLGVHHATVIRHIDALEARLGIKLFQRHARGYTPTEAGEDLMRVAQATEDQFNQLSSRIKGKSDTVSGELVVTSLPSLTRKLAPVLSAFQAQCPDVTLRYLTGERLYRLEYGEAHVAIRAGVAPDQPDNVVQPFFQQQMGLYATTAYLEAHGRPETLAGFAGHRFVGSDDDASRAPFNTWLQDLVDAPVYVFRTNDTDAMTEAVYAGCGIGFAPVDSAGAIKGLEQVWPHQPEWISPFWLVTHVDLHRTAKVQTFLTFLKQQAKPWG